jgi:hypothetical protein
MAQAAPSESAEQLRDAFLQFSGGVADRNDRYKVNCPMNSTLYRALPISGRCLHSSCGATLSRYG